VIAALSSMPVRVFGCGQTPWAKPLPPRTFGAIMTVQWRLFRSPDHWSEPALRHDVL
jgi:hypothetical protein